MMLIADKTLKACQKLMLSVLTNSHFCNTIGLLTKIIEK